MNPRAVKDFDIALELAGGNETKAREYLKPVHQARTLQFKLVRALEAMSSSRAGDIVGNEVQSSTTDPSHVRWVDWYETARQTIDQLLSDSP